MPSGDDWGGPESLNDNLLFGGAKAFRANAQQWQLLRDDRRYTVKKWIDEGVSAHAMSAAGVSVARGAVAYCKVDVQGACRYFGQLARSIELVGGALLHLRPEVAGLLCMAASGPCNATTDTDGSALLLQTPEDATRDPHWCRLLQEVERARACPSGWQGQKRFQHRR